MNSCLVYSCLMHSFIEDTLSNSHTIVCCTLLLNISSHLTHSLNAKQFLIEVSIPSHLRHPFTKPLLSTLSLYHHLIFLSPPPLPPPLLSPPLSSPSPPSPPLVMLRISHCPRGQSLSHEFSRYPRLDILGSIFTIRSFVGQL